MLRLRRFLLLTVIALKVFCLNMRGGAGGQLKPQAPKDYGIPSQFRARIGGYMGAIYRVELRGNSLRYTYWLTGVKHQPITITPTAEQWREFRAALEQAKVWRWKATYASPGIVDGTQWSLELKYADRSITTKGDNNYPGDSADAESHGNPGHLFRLYTDAMNKLLGGRNFG
jgi:hypothetical protein